MTKVKPSLLAVSLSEDASFAKTLKIWYLMVSMTA